ncbi:hypothetical protein [Cohnella massiliensis]|uniref:hypothetical protein n=1 Tax=Cohnella massiliensis TaxID=1816691 RepID=UPI0009BC520B|nr:hypothetical protein [Cohnella massiliensis]
MFKKFSRRIALITIVSVSAFTAVVGALAYEWAKRTVVSEFAAISANSFQSSFELLEQFLNATGETAKMIANNPNLAVAVGSPNAFGEASLLLDSLAYGADLNILGISLYRPDGTVYAMSGMSNFPPFEQLAAETAVRRFLDDPDLQTMWVSRYRNLASYYNYRYVENGTFSLLLKGASVREAMTGTVMVFDLETVALFDFFVTNNALFSQNRLFLVRDGSDIVRYASGPGEEAIEADDLRRLNESPGGRFVSIGGDRLILHETILGSNTKIVAAVPLTGSLSRLEPLKGAVLLLGLVSAAGAVAAAIWLRASIVRPLNQLYLKMKSLK